MKTRFNRIISAFIFSIFIFQSYHAFSIEIPILGKAGVEIVNGNIKICPGFSLRKCASISITWSDIINFVANDNSSPPLVSVSMFDESGNPLPGQNLEIRLIRINLSNILHDTPPESLSGDNLLFK